MSRQRTVLACVLRSGGDFEPEHVVEFQDGLDRFLPSDVRRVCLTDLPDEVVEAGWRDATIALSRDWTGWWSKINLFGPGMVGRDERVLYADLDTRFVGSLDDVVGYDGAFAMLSDFNREERTASGLMSWRPSPATTHLFAEFVRREPEIRRTSPRGDQEYIGRELAEVGVEVDRWQDMLPGQVVSYKAHVRGRQYGRHGGGNGRVPEGARVVCYHGKPRPWEEPLPR